MEDLLQLIQQKRTHTQRLAAANGAAGEVHAIARQASWLARPKGIALKNILAALAETGVDIKGSSFDVICLPDGLDVDFLNMASIRAVLSEMLFIEVKTATQARVKEGFDGFFFALTENEIQAAAVLGKQHRVALHNKMTGELLITSVPEILQRKKSSTWQLSVQL